MRIWSLHPKFLDAKGLVALWRETLLARHVLEGKTKGYRHHPQLNRFKTAENPVECINSYLFVVFEEAESRGYRFDKNKIGETAHSSRLPVTVAQVAFERQHLINKLKIRDPVRYDKFLKVNEVEVHPLFYEVEGDPEG